jgi:hypothetical protein
MKTLRKACRKCTTSKRKCVVQKPKCIRCLQKNFDCVYDLEPLTTPLTESEILFEYGVNLSTCHLEGICIMKRTFELQAPDIDPAICTPGRDKTIELTRIGFDTVPDCIRFKKPATFVHPKLQLPGVYNHFTALLEKHEEGVDCENFKYLVQIDFETLSLREALTALQAFLVHLAASIFSSIPIRQEEGGTFFHILYDWTKALLANVDAGMPKSQTLWQDWLLAESKLRQLLFLMSITA